MKELKEKGIVASTVPVVEGMVCASAADSEHSSPSNVLRLVASANEITSLQERLQAETAQRESLQGRLAQLRQQHEKERKLLFEQAEAGQRLLAAVPESGDSKESALVAQLRAQVAQVRDIAESRTREVQELLMVKTQLISHASRTRRTSPLRYFLLARSFLFLSGFSI